MIHLNCGAKATQRFAYRRAKPSKVIATYYAESLDDQTKYCNLQDKLASSLGFTSDNHEAYRVEEDGVHFFLVFSDWTIYVCLDVEVTGL